MKQYLYKWVRSGRHELLSYKMNSSKDRECLGEISEILEQNKNLIETNSQLEFQLRQMNTN